MGIDYWFRRHENVFLKNFKVTCPIREVQILGLMEFEMLVVFLSLRFHLVIRYLQGSNDQLYPALMLVRSCFRDFKRY